MRPNVLAPRAGYLKRRGTTQPSIQGRTCSQYIEAARLEQLTRGTARRRIVGLVNIILLEQHEASDPATVCLSDQRARHIVDVLKTMPGQTMQIGIIDGPLGRGTVISRSEQAVTLACEFDLAPPSRAPVDLLLALPRPKVMKRLWAQLAALGVGRILLTNASRVERQYFDTHVLTSDCYRPLLVEGLQQARDTRLPVVSIHRQLKILVEDHLDGLFEGVRLVADPRVGTTTSRAMRFSTAERVLIAIGPEGGWSHFEL